MKKLLEALQAIYEPREEGEVIFFSGTGRPFPSGEVACDAIRDRGEVVVVHGADSGDHGKVFQALGFLEVHAVDSGAAGGTRGFLVKDVPSGLYYLGFQSIAKPPGDFSYTVDFELSFESRREYEMTRG